MSDDAAKAHKKRLAALSADVATTALAMYRAKLKAKDATEAFNEANEKLDGAVGDGPEELPLYDSTGA